MSQLQNVLRDEPTALGTLIASIAPLLVLSGVIRIDEHAIAALVVAINAVVGFSVRLLVTPRAHATAAQPVWNQPEVSARGAQ